MNKKTKSILIWAGIVAAVVVIIAVSVLAKNQPGELDDFARCINQSGAKFYGAFWCPHCQDQKEMFGNSERLLPYIECSTPSGQGTTSECQQAGIEAYPTWQWPDASRETGSLSLDYIAGKTGCKLNQ